MTAMVVIITNATLFTGIGLDDGRLPVEGSEINSEGDLDSLLMNYSLFGLPIYYGYF
jgi:hypothetical protein